MPPFQIDPRMHMGAVTLAVADLLKLSAFYQQIIGLKMLTENEGEVVLGVAPARPLVRLLARPYGQSFPRRPGLFHLAILVPDRPALGQWINHLAQSGYQLDGAGDHLVSEALYLSDPEGNGIEIYADRPRESWPYRDGKLLMDTLAVDIPALQQVARSEPFSGLPPETIMGHVHLRVSEVAQAVAFYRDVLGIPYITDFPGAGFLGAGGYHHHIGLNAWHSRRAEAPPADALGLVNLQIVLPDEGALGAVRNSLDEHGVDIREVEEGLVAADPDQNHVLLSVRVE